MKLAGVPEALEETRDIHDEDYSVTFPTLGVKILMANLLVED